MRFEKRQVIDGTPAEVEQALLSEEYLVFLLKHHGVLLEAKLLDKKDEGQKVTRRVRYLPKPVIESIGPKKVPHDWFAFVENSTWDKTQKAGQFSNVPVSNKISSMLVNTGTIRLRDMSDGKTERTMDGEIHLKLPFLLKLLTPIAEAVIHREGLKILDAEAPVMNRFIAEVLRKK